MDTVKVVLLGAQAVGKTSIIKQFIWNEFSDDYKATDRKQTYFPSVIINDRLYEMKISDIPVIPYFPMNSYCEWSDFRFYGLRSATAYVLVFDLCNVDSFQYIRTLRDQMTESRDMRHVPVLVVGNKQDLLQPTVSGTVAVNGVVASGSGGASGVCQIVGGGYGSGQTGSNSLVGATSAALEQQMRERRRDFVTLVRKQWKCAYVECSAKYNWHVVAVFKELMKAVDALHMGKEVCSPMMDNIHGALDRNKCSIQ